MKRSYKEIANNEDNIVIKKPKLMTLNTTTDFLKLHSAIFSGNLELVKQLKSNEILTKIVDGYTLMHIAAACGQIRIMEWLRDEGHIVDETSIDGYTPLYVAASYGELGSVEWLLKNGAKVINFKNFKFMESVVLKAEKIIIISELLNWTIFADGVCNYITMINPLKVSDNSYNSLFIARIKYNLLKNGLKNDFKSFIECLAKCSLPNDLIETIKVEIDQLINKTQQDVLKLEAKLMSQIDKTESSLPLNELLAQKTTLSPISIEKTLEVCSLSYPKSNYYIQRFKRDALTDPDKIILNETLKKEAGGYLDKLPIESLMLTMAKTPDICKSMKVLSENTLLNMNVKYYLHNALRKHEDNISNPVIKFICQVQENLCLEINELQKKFVIMEEKCEKLENLLGDVTNYLTKNKFDYAAFIADPDDVLGVTNTNLEATNTLNC